MKRLLASLFFLSLFLCACSAKQESGALPTLSDELSTLRRQVEYYEARATELEGELTEAKVELYLQQIEYESRLQALESAASKAPEEAASEIVWFYEETASGAVITGVRGADRVLEIPSELGGLPVVAIGDNAFENASVSSVILPDGMREIGWFAFSGCRDLQNITLPASVEKIEYGAFENCPKNLLFLCPEGSYAAAYARSYGFGIRPTN